MIATIKLRSFWLAILGWCAVLIVWYGHSRLLSAHRCTRIVHIDSTNDFPHQITTLRLATYNIAHGRGGTADASNWTGASRQENYDHLSKIARQIEDTGADIVVLNEVDFASPWSGHVNQAQIIAEMADFSVCVEQRNYDVAFPFMAFRFGNALLSKYPVSDVRTLRLPPLSKTEAILAGNHDGLMATVQTPLGDIRVLAVHLDSRSEGVRVKCARIIEQLVSQEGPPCVVIGDFNSAPRGTNGHMVSVLKENAVDILLNSKLLTTINESADWPDYLTFPSSQPNVAIDWILCSPDIEQVSPTVVQSSLSDHLMVVSDIRLEMPPIPANQSNAVQAGHR